MRQAGRLSPGTRRSRLTRIALVAGLNLLLCIVLLAAAELAVRLRATIKYGTTATPEDLYETDARIGLRVAKANLSAGPIRTNSLGFRGPEVPVPKPPRTLRLAFLGASTTWCAEVSGNDRTWPSLVTDGMRSRVPGRRWDYVNGAVPGYTVASSLLNLRHRVAPLKPDVIIIYHATNDLSGELRDIAHAQGLLDTQSFEPLAWPARYSLLCELAEKNLRIMAAQRAAGRNASRLRLDAAALGEGFRRDLEALVREAQRHASVVALATFATQLRRDQTPEQLRKASESAMFYMPFMDPEGLIRAYDRYNEVIRQVAAATGALLIDAAESVPGTPDHFTDTVHFTDAGSRAMAERVLRALEHVSWDVEFPDS